MTQATVILRGVDRRAGRAAGALVIAAALALGAVACGSSSRLDQAGTERAVRRSLGSRLGWPIERIVCPGDIPGGDGEVVICRAVLDDGAGSVRLKVTQVEGGRTVEVALVDAVVDRQQAARQLHKVLVDRFGRPFRTSCGTGPPAVVAPGKTLPCYARDDSGPRSVTATVVDPAGTLRFDVS